MVTFAPEVSPTNDPSYFKFSEAVKEPAANQAGLYAGKSAADSIEAVGIGLKGAVDLTDTAIKDSIKSEATTRTDSERDAFSNALTNTAKFGNPAGATQGTDEGPQDPSNGASGPGPGGPDLMATQPAVPPAISKGIGTIQTAQNALAGNKISETTYYQRTDSIAKDLRSRYGAGYRDYIDEQISKITGVNPANAYIRSIIQDLNRQGSKQQSEQEKWTAFIRQNSDLPGAPEMLQRYQQSGDSNAVMQWANYNGGVKNMLSLKKAAMEVDTADKAANIAKATDYAQSVVSNIATNGFYNMKFMVDEKTGAQIVDTISKASRDPSSVTDEQMQRLSQTYEMKKVEATNAAMQTLFTKDPATGKSVADRIGADAAKKMVDTNVAALFDSTSNLLKDKQFGPAYSNLNRSVAVVNDAKMAILGDPQIGRQIALTGAINNIAPNVAPQLISGALQTGLDLGVRNFVDSQAHKALAQPDLSKNGKPYTFSQSIDELKTAGITDGKAFRSLTNLRAAITQNESPALKETAIRYFFDPKNSDVMSKIKDDYYDPNLKRTVQGASAAYYSLTAPEITQSVKSLADKGHPEVWKNYSEWAKNSFGYLFINSVNDLNDAVNDQHFHITYNPEGKLGTASNLNVSWDNKEHKLGIVNADGSPLAGLQATSLNLPYRTIVKLNEGLSNLREIAKAEGTNVDAYMMKTLKAAGFSPNRAMDGVPYSIMKAIIQSNTPPEPKNGP